MKIGILGAGRMGQALIELLQSSGHEVSLGSRTPGRANVPAVAWEEAIAEAEAIVVALPHDAIDASLEVLATIADGTVVIDVANAVRVEDGRIRSALDRPHGRWLADRLPQVSVARAFTHVHDELLVSRASRQPHAWAMAVAADDPGALAVTEELVRAAGYVPVHVGNLDRSAVLDPGGPLFPNMYLPGDMLDLLDQRSA